jgi:D-alanyl-D-alanine carboxypeptidase
LGGWDSRRAISLVMALSACLLVMAQPVLARVPFSAISVDARTGKLLFSLDADGRRHPASLTKMMTLYLLFSDLKAGRIKLSTPITISRRAASMSPSKLGAKPGTSITVDQAIRAIVVISANDVAAAIAENLGGSESNFAQRMTRTALGMGMTRSNFANASGLPNPNQWTTARDIATLSLRLMRDFPEYYPYFSTMSFTYGGRVVRTHNRLLGRYAGADGIKTGYTAASGFNLTSSAERDGRRVVGVVLGASSAGSRNIYMMRMLDTSFPKCLPGKVIVARAGSSAGAVDPSHPPAATGSAQSDPARAKTAGKVAVASRKPEAKTAVTDDTPGQIAKDGKVANDVAQGTGDGSLEGTSGSTIQTVTPDATKSSRDVKPKVLQAQLSPAMPADLPFQVKPEAKQSEVDAQAVASLNQDPAWHIQIGPYPSRDDAVKQVQALQAKDLAVLNDKQAFAVTVKIGNVKSYRGRFTGFTERDARTACAEIIRLNKPCQVVAPNS